MVCNKLLHVHCSDYNCVLDRGRKFIRDIPTTAAAIVAVYNA